ncbi:glycoside hydrolase family 88/105 protein [Nitratireductor thuwali]|uniref:24.9 kDa protein in picA locus n=1 Tax=Nitratireductor thuwali TaxID=2267699 RepID=A0ABY5MP73_9HYPH|nr:24.9 kDa protein in picA locus [Nitratireductor thuwali]
MLMEYFDNYAAAYTPYKGGSWCYEDGCIYRGLALLHEATGDRRWFAHLKRLLDAQISPDGDLAGYTVEEFNIDHILPGRALIYLYQATGDEKYRAGAHLLARQLALHPRTRSGVYWHKKVYPWQIWLDGIYMGLPFQMEFARLSGDDALVDDALKQLTKALSLTWEKTTGLYAHGYDESRQQQWADPDTGRSSAHWARALGWLAMALVDIAELVGTERLEAAGAGEHMRALLAQVLALRAADGTWLQVIDRPDLPGNYAESSATAMFAYALLKAGRIGFSEEFASVGHGSLLTLAGKGLRDDGTGTLRLGGICHVAGLGGLSNVYRDGTASYYLTEPVVEDDAKGVGPLMMAEAESIRFGLRRREHPIVPAASSRL